MNKEIKHYTETKEIKAMPMTMGSLRAQAFENGDRVTNHPLL